MNSIQENFPGREASGPRPLKVFQWWKASSVWPGSALLGICLFITACAGPYVYSGNEQRALPALYDAYAEMDDGYRLPLARWGGGDRCKDVVLGVHGLNDYRKSFETTGTYLASRGICLIAYDQRGFGETEGAGFWHGSERLGRDLETLTGLLREGCPDCRLFLLGESMGGALILANLKTVGPDLQGAILLAPAVWSRNTMPYYQQAALWVAVHTFPGRKLTGEGLGIVASDNADMLRALGQDPLVIKATRVDVLYGTSNLMDIASGISSEQETSVLFLYGKRDEIIPPGPICQFIASQSLESGDLWSIVLYENGYHMLTRDLQGEQVLQDISHWLDGRVVRGQAPLGQVEAFCADVQGLPDNRGVVIKE